MVWPMKYPVKKARLDADRNEKPLTLLTATIVGRTTKYACPAQWYVDAETGERIHLGAS